jgi:molybdopterin-guanine dinucleotide biosynthesis protein A
MLLERTLGSAVVSIGQGARGSMLYDGFPLVEDGIPASGPLSGIVSVHRAYPEVALFIVAVDLFGLTASTVQALVELRREAIRDRGDRLGATTLCAADGGPEPLCAIWEPWLLREAGDQLATGGRSPRALLRSVSGVVVGPGDREVHNINTRDDLKRYCRPGLMEERV